MSNCFFIVKFVWFTVCTVTIESPGFSGSMTTSPPANTETLTDLIDLLAWSFYCYILLGFFPIRLRQFFLAWQLCKIGFQNCRGRDQASTACLGGLCRERVQGDSPHPPITTDGESMYHINPHWCDHTYCTLIWVILFESYSTVQSSKTH